MGDVSLEKFAEITLSRVAALAPPEQRHLFKSVVAQALDEAQLAMKEALAGTLPTKRIKPAEVTPEVIGLSLATLYRAAASGRFYGVTPSGKSIGVEFPAWQFVDPVPALLPTILSRFEGQPRSEVHAFFVTARDELNELAPAEVLAGKPFATRESLHPSQAELLKRTSGARAEFIQQAVTRFLAGPADLN